MFRTLNRRVVEPVLKEAMEMIIDCGEERHENSK
jgi:hypothetical protein